VVERRRPKRRGSGILRMVDRLIPCKRRARRIETTQVVLLRGLRLYTCTSRMCNCLASYIQGEPRNVRTWSLTQRKGDGRSTRQIC
jgi:hypothetical protein